MKYFLSSLAWVMSFMFLTVNGVEASIPHDIFQQNKNVEISPLYENGRNVIKFENVFSARELYYEIKSQLNRLTKERKGNFHPRIVIPYRALNQEAWIELITEVEKRGDLLIDVLISNKEIIEAFIFALP